MNPRIIKKYPNRRLYDTEVSSYITVDEIKDLVLNHVPFKVLDAKTTENVTDIVLLQIINEQEAGQAPLFTTEILQGMIRFYGNPLQKTMSQFLEKNFSLFNNNPNEFKKHLESMISNYPAFDTLSQMTKQNMAIFQSMTEQLLNKKSTQKASKKAKRKKSK